MSNLIEIIKSFGTGFVVGVVFALLHLPIPAPSVLAGVMGIVGIFMGYVLIKNLLKI